MKVNEFINETASVGASAAGAIAAAPAAAGSMQRRKKKKQNDLDLAERHKPGNWVVITKGRFKGQEGTIGEIHNGPHSSAPKTYIIDLGGDFHNGSVQLKPGMFKAKRTVNEDFDELVQVEFNNERAMELAQQKFDFDWNGDNMYLDPQQVGRMEDLLVSSGFTEPDDFQIEPQNPNEDAVYEAAPINTSIIPADKKRAMANAILKQVEYEGWKVRNKREAGLRVDEFLDATLGWPTVPKFMSPYQKAAREFMVQTLMANKDKL